MTVLNAPVSILGTSGRECAATTGEGSCSSTCCLVGGSSFDFSVLHCEGKAGGGGRKSKKKKKEASGISSEAAS